MPGRRDDSFGYDEQTLERLSRFTLEPVVPEEITTHLDAGDSLETVDIPDHLGRKLAIEVETGVGLYRLIQLFGTPNIPGLEAGKEATKHDRYLTTWQYLFTVDYEPTPDSSLDAPDPFLLSVYDYKTDISCGISGWTDTAKGAVHEPESAATEVDTITMPDPTLLELVIQLVLNMVEEPVPATFKELWT